MIALDTNVFVRFLVNTPDGETEQVRRARELVTAAERRGEDILVTHVVLVETVWVLRKATRCRNGTSSRALGR
jgi:predicted nucleic acid-binding protein